MLRVQSSLVVVCAWFTLELVGSLCAVRTVVTGWAGVVDQVRHRLKRVVTVIACVEDDQVMSCRNYVIPVELN